MSPSRSQLNRWFRNLILILLLGGFYSFGFMVGNKPHLFKRYIDFTQDEVYFYLQDPNLLSERMRQLLINKSQARIRFIIEDAQVSDLWLADFSTVKNLSSPVENFETKEWLSLFAKAAPDFQLNILRTKHFLPLLWSKQQNLIKLEGLWVNDSTKVASLLKIEQVFMSEEFQKLWLSEIKWNTTILKMDDSSLPADRKASALRNFEIQHLQWAI